MLLPLEAKALPRTHSGEGVCFFLFFFINAILQSEAETAVKPFKKTFFSSYCVHLFKHFEVSESFASAHRLSQSSSRVIRLCVCTLPPFFNFFLFILNR